VEEWLHAFLASALDGGGLLVLYPGHFVSGKGAPNAYWMGVWVGPGAGLDTVMGGDL